MTDQRLPGYAHDIDAAWLTRALAPRHPGVQVTGVEVLERHEVTNAHARLRLHFAARAGAPETLFCKVPPADPARRHTESVTGMGRREVAFYSSLAPRLALRVPDAHVALADDRDGSFVLLLEDLVAAGARISDGTWGVTPDAAARALEELADLHVRFQDPTYRATEAPWVPEPRHGSTYGADMLRIGLAHHRERLSRDFATIAEIYIEHGAALHALWHTGAKTVIHGDTHIGNLFDDGGRTGFLDWGIIMVGLPMREVSYFLNMAMSIDDRRIHERDLIRHYLAVQQSLGGPTVTFDDAWRTHRVQAAYTVPASCQIVTFPPDISERRRVFSEAFLARAEAAVADLEARAALREVGGL